MAAITLINNFMRLKNIKPKKDGDGHNQSRKIEK